MSECDTFRTRRKGNFYTLKPKAYQVKEVRASPPKDLYSIGSYMVHMVQKRDNIEMDIIETLLRQENHVRGIAKQLNESHSTISRKLINLKRENVIDSRNEGKNKIFFLKQNLITKSYTLQSELHKLTKLLRQYPELSIVFEEILKKTDENLIVLFGSYAKGLAKKESDIDIYIESKSRNVKKSIEEIHSKINVKIGAFDTKSPLIKEIIKDHIIIRGIEVFYEKKQFFE
jgi:predicted nucleotidyltransferase